MKNIFIIDGAGGTGKSDLLTYLQRKQSNNQFATTLTKFTTRDKRLEEKSEDYLLDLDFVSNDEFNVFCQSSEFYHYGYGDSRYGFFKSKLEDAVLGYKNIFIIVRNKELTQQLKNDFKDVRFVCVYIYSDLVEVEKRLTDIGYSRDRIEFRLQRSKIAWQDYLRYSKDYDEVIINNSNITDYERLIEQLIEKYNVENVDYLEVSKRHKYKLLKPLVGYRDEISKRIERRPFEKNVFLMMKFRPNNMLLYEYIRDVLEVNGFNCVRADQPEWNITNSIYNPIATLYACKFGIALFDLPEEKNEFSPNVAYELGIMHLQGKNCLILKHQSLSQMPFDIIKDLYKEYSEELQIKNIIKQWVINIKGE